MKKMLKTKRLTNKRLYIIVLNVLKLNLNEDIIASSLFWLKEIYLRIDPYESAVLSQCVWNGFVNTETDIDTKTEEILNHYM